MSTWSLKINSTTSTLNALGIQSFDLNLMNLGEDTLTLNEKPGALNATPILSYGDTVQLIEDTTIRYIGTCTTNPRVGMPGQLEQRSYACKNILWDLNRIIYEQDWHEDETNTFFKGRVQLGKDIDDARITLDAALLDIVGFAQTAGLSFSVNYAGLTAIPPDSEYVDITCFEAIRNLLNWAPSVATSVDYSSGTPVINFVKRASATSAVYTATALQGLAVTPRNDLLLSGVLINYEIQNDVDGELYTTTSQDSAGTTTGLNVLKQTVELYGVEASSTVQEVDIVVGTPGDSTDSAFWLDAFPGLSAVTDLVINSGTDPSELATYPNELLSGQVMSWMKNGSTQVAAVEAEFTADISFKYNGKKIENIPVAHKMVLTNATTQTYSQTTAASYTPAEEVPTGLAAFVLAQRNTLHYNGTLQLVGLEPDWTATPSNVVNIQPGELNKNWDDADEWDDTLQWLEKIDGFTGLDAINAVVESIRIIHAPAGCSTTINIGPPSHLQAQDFVAMARATRTRVASEYSRKDPDTSATGAVQLSGTGPNSNSGMLAGSGLPAATAVSLAVFDPTTGVERWKVLAKGTAGQHLATTAAGLIDWTSANVLPDPDLGNILVGNGTSWQLLPPGNANTILRSSGTSPVYDVAIESGTATGQLMVWDTAAGGGSGGIKSESLPAANGFITQQTSGTIGHTSGTNAILWHNASSNPQLANLPSTAGLLYYDGNGGFSAVTIPSSGLLIGNGTSFSSTSYIKSGGYFLY